MGAVAVESGFAAAERDRAAVVRVVLAFVTEKLSAHYIPTGEQMCLFTHSDLGLVSFELLLQNETGEVKKAF